MLAALLVFAVFCACLGAFRRGEDGRVAFNVPALALLASVATTSAFVWLGVPFDWRLWGAIDIAVIGAMLLSGMTTADWLILPLFIPAWIAYGDPDAFAHDVTTVTVALQLLLTFPVRHTGQIFRRLVARWKANFQNRDEWTDLERRGQREVNA